MATRKKPTTPVEAMKPMPKMIGPVEAVNVLPPPVQLPVEVPQSPAQAPQVVHAMPTPADIPTLMNEAMAAHARGDLPAAERLYGEVLGMNWAEPEVLRRVGEVCLAQARHRDALEPLLRAVALHAHDARTLAQVGVAYSFIGDLPKAKHYYDRAIAVSPNFPLARWNRSLYLLWAGEYAEGWDEYRWGTLLGVRPNRHIEPQWDGKYYHMWPAAKDKTRSLYVWAEQGFGDALMFLRFTRGLKEKFGFKRIVLEVQAPLLPLLWDYDRDDIDLVVGQQADGGFVEPFDEHISLAELPRVLSIHPGNIPAGPYLTVRPHPAVQNWRQGKKAEGKTLVGFVYRGNPGHVNDRARSVEIERFEQLAKVAGVEFVPLWPMQPHEKPAFCPTAFDLADFEKTAQVIQELDLVITVDTAVAHLAGAMGKPCWLLLSKSCDWRWHPVPGKPEKAVWYDSVRLYRQDVYGDWEGPFRRIRADLEVLANPAPLLGPGDPAWAVTEEAS